jgi:hypothetical protein
MVINGHDVANAVPKDDANVANGIDRKFLAPLRFK